MSKSVEKRISVQKKIKVHPVLKKAHEAAKKAQIEHLHLEALRVAAELTEKETRQRIAEEIRMHAEELRLHAEDVEAEKPKEPGWFQRLASWCGLGPETGR